MSGERKLSLVKPPASAPASDEAPAGVGLPSGSALPDGEPEVTEDERREAEALRKALDRGDDPVAEALRAAFAPAPLAEGDLDAILARALAADAAEAVDAPATSIEAREAERLRVALDEHDALRAGRVVMGPGARGGAREDGNPAVAVALRAAWAPAPIAAAKNDVLVKRALDAADTRALNAAKRGLDVQSPAVGESGARDAAAAQKAASEKEAPAPISLRRFRLGARTLATMTAVVALAAGVLLFVGRLGQQAEPTASIAQAPAASPQAKAVAATERTPRIASRSTTDLFDAATPFPRTGGESARVDRIAGARAADLRANRFAAWGVR